MSEGIAIGAARLGLKVECGDVKPHSRLAPEWPLPFSEAGVLCPESSPSPRENSECRGYI